jgi:prenylcysteine oxidase/farnesylcysteine lyase
MPSPYLYRVAPVASLLLILGTLYLTAPFRSEQRSLDVAGVEIWDQSTAQLPLVTPPEAKKRVAIIGAGASGSASAFWLERAAREAGLKEGELELVIFERQPYVGGSGLRALRDLGSFQC